MADLSEAEILTLAKAAGVKMPPALVAEVGYVTVQTGINQREDQRGKSR